MKVIELHHASAILTGSKLPPGYSGEFGAPEFNNIGDEEWWADLLSKWRLVDFQIIVL